MGRFNVSAMTFAFPAKFSVLCRKYFLVIALVLPLFLAVGFAFILPYFAAFWGAFSGGAELGFLKNAGILHITLFTLEQAFFSVLVALAIGLPGAWFLGSGKAHPLLRAITAIPFAMPSILVVLGFVLFFGNSGWLNSFFAVFPRPGSQSFQLRILYKPEAIILAHGFFNFPLVIRLAGDGLSRARKAYSQAASSLGASPLVCALTILLPLSLPAIMAASLLVFLYSFTSFAVVLVLGGGPATTTLPVEIYRNARIFLNYSNAGALALIETSIAIALFLCYIFFSKKSRRIEISSEERFSEEKDTNRKTLFLSRAFVLGYALFAAIFILGPLVSIGAESLLTRSSRSAEQVISLKWWLSLGESCLPALSHSLVLAFFSAALSCALALTAAMLVKILEGNQGKINSAMANIIRFFTVAPIVSSGIIMGLGWLVLYGGNFSRSPWALVVLHSVTALPFAFNFISEGFRSIPANTLNAALVSGAGPFRAMLTTALPISLPHLRSAWAFAAALSLGELNAVMMLGMEGWETLPLYIYRAAGAYRYGAACAAGSLLMLACSACFLVSEAGRKNVA